MEKRDSLPSKRLKAVLTCMMIAAVLGTTAFATSTIAKAEDEIGIADVNGDGKIGVLDACVIQRGIKFGFSDDTVKAKADINKDGTIDNQDVDALLKYIVSIDSDKSNDSNNTDNNVDKDKTDSNTDNNVDKDKTDSNTDNNVDKDKTDSNIDNNVDKDKTDSNTDSKSSLDMNQIQKKIVEAEPKDANQEKQGVKYGTYEKKTIDSTVCKRKKNFKVLLPAGYDKSKKYPVMYVLHGFWGNEDSMSDDKDASLRLRMIIGNAIASGEAKDMIVVFPDIYASATQDKCSAMDNNNVAAYNNFINLLIKEIMPYMEKNYPIKTGRNNTAITGFSMGGLEALSIGLSKSDMFAYVGGICPAPGLDTNKLANNKQNPLSLLMLSAGSNDDVVQKTPVGYHDQLVKNNVTHVWHYLNGGYHGGNTIRAHMYNFVRYVFK